MADDVNIERTWRAELRGARRALGLSQRALAAAAGVSYETVRGYENGRRHPTRQRLEAIMFALNLPNAAANAIRQEAGFAILPTVVVAERDRDYYYTAQELVVAVEDVPWPEFVLDDALELVAANAVVRALWGMEGGAGQAIPRRVQRNLLVIAGEHRFAERMVNWDECVATIVSVFRAREPRPQSLEEPDPYFARVIDAFAGSDPSLLPGLMDAWSVTEGRNSRVRWGYRVVWRDPVCGEMRFIAQVSLASEPDALGFNDWIPVDAPSWTALERVKAGAGSGRQR